MSLDFSVTFPSDETMALGSTQPLVKMSTRGLRRPVHKADDVSPYCAAFKNSRSHNFPRPLWACMACYRSALPFYWVWHILSLIMKLAVLYWYDVWSYKSPYLCCLRVPKIVANKCNVSKSGNYSNICMYIHVFNLKHIKKHRLEFLCYLKLFGRV